LWFIPIINYRKSISILCIVVARGTGKEGNVKGMVASWEYVLTNWPDPAPDGSYFYYKFKGTLLKK
jgi:hypothetical protein